MEAEIDLECRYYDMVPIGMQRGYTPAVVKLAKPQTALLLVDVYGRGYSEGEPVPEREPLWFPGSFALVRSIMRDSIAPCLQAAREAGLHIVYVNNSNPLVRADLSEFGAVLRRTHRLTDAERWLTAQPAEFEFSSCVAPRPVEYVCPKLFYGGFEGTFTDILLRNLGVKNLVAVGFATNACLHTTLTEAMYRNYRVILLRDCTAGMECDDTYARMGLTQAFVRFIETHVGFTATADGFQKSIRSTTGT